MAEMKEHQIDNEIQTPCEKKMKVVAAAAAVAAVRNDVERAVVNDRITGLQQTQTMMMMKKDEEGVL